MKTETADWAQVVEALGALRQEVSRLNERVAALEAGAAPPARAGAPGASAAPPSRAAGPAAPAPAGPEGIDEELVLVLGAAIAAFLGKRPHIRQIRLLGSPAWGQQGRVTIQASHALSVHHGHGHGPARHG